MHTRPKAGQESIIIHNWLKSMLKSGDSFVDNRFFLMINGGFSAFLTVDSLSTKAAPIFLQPCLKKQISTIG